MGVRNLVSAFLSPVATTLIGWLGGYNATDPRRKILDGSQLLAPQKTTANQLLNGNLSALRGYCRNLERNNPTARAGIEALTALVVGSGISLEPDTGDEILDGQLRDMFNEWCEKSSVCGQSIWYLQALGMREMVTAGEGLWRIVYDRDAERMGFLPLRILPLDAEWIRDDEGTSNDITTVAGIQIDNLGRPVNYLLRNPETEGNPEVVSAKSVIHFFERRRPIQNRGEPWFAPLIETLIQERDLVDAELKAAVSTASLGIAIESEYQPDLDTDEYGTNTDPVQQLKLGAAVRLFPGEKVHPFSHTRPSQQIAPFRQMLRGDIAAALRIPQRFLDRDVSRANYSSMRADMVDTERILGPVREWYGRATIGRVYEMLLPYMAAKLGIAMPRPDYRLLPDGQAYVDPQKDIAAALMAIDGGLSTHEAEAGKRGGDYRQIWKQLRKEQEDRAAAGPAVVMSKSGSAPAAQHAQQPEQQLAADEAGQ